MAIEEDDDSCKKCIYCYSDMHHSASVCRSCGKYQNKIINYIENIGHIIAFVMLFIAYFQLQEAKQERVLAKQAYDAANASNEKSIELSNSVKNIFNDIENQRNSISNLSNESKIYFDVIKTVSDKSEIIDTKINTIDDNIKNSYERVKELNEIIDIYIAITKAKSDDKDSFFRLLQMIDENHQYKNMIDGAIGQIIYDLSSSGLRLSRKIDWKKYNIDIDNLKPEDAFSYINKIPQIYVLDFLEDIWKNEKFSKLDRLDFFYEVMNNAKSLRASNFACGIINYEAKINKNILGLKDYNDWWINNRSSYTIN